MVILQFDKGMTSLMKVIALTILLLMLAPDRFRERSCESKCFLMNRLWKTNSWIRKKSGQQSGTLILTNGTQLRMVRQCAAQLVGGAHIGNERKSGG
jgi:hypothetical protein